MKKILTFFVVSIIFCSFVTSCCNNLEPTTTKENTYKKFPNLDYDEYCIIEIDNCDYIVWRYANESAGLLHSSSCKNHKQEDNSGFNF